MEVIHSADEIVEKVKAAFDGGGKVVTLATDYHWINYRLTEPEEAYKPRDAVYYRDITFKEIYDALTEAGFYVTCWIGQSNVFVITRCKFEGNRFNPIRDYKILINS